MHRLVAIAATITLTAVLSGCGADAHEEAPSAATADAIVKAPPGAVGADIMHATVAASTPTKTGNVPQPHGGNTIKPAPDDGAEPAPAEPVPDPLAPAPGGKPPKGTDL